MENSGNRGTAAKKKTAKNRGKNEKKTTAPILTINVEKAAAFVVGATGSVGGRFGGRRRASFEAFAAVGLVVDPFAGSDFLRVAKFF